MAKLTDTLAALARLREQGAYPAPADGGGLSELKLKGVNPGDLRMRFHAPSPLPAGSPLVVVLHGCSQTAEAYAAGAGWMSLADHCGFAVLCPEQTRANNPNLCFNWFEPADTTRGSGEAASIANMIEQVTAEYDLDSRRVFITGLSAGGAMTAVMLATYPELFAAGAIFAGLPYGAASNMNEAFQAMFQGASRPAEAWGDRVRAASRHRGHWPRVSVWHGDADTVVRPGASDELVKQWVDVHGAKPSDSTSRTTGRETRVWTSPAGEPVVELHRIPNMAHGTPLSAAGPDGYGAAGPYLLEVGVSSSLELATAWGIAGKRVRPALAKPSFSPRAPSRQAAAEAHADGGAHATTLLTRPKLDVGEVIAKALRSAGLSK